MSSIWSKLINLGGNITGTLAVANGGTGVTSSTGSVAVVLSTSPTLVTPILGTPNSGTLTSCTGLPLTSGVTGTLPVANGGTGVTASTGTVAVVLSTTPTLVTPVLGVATATSITWSDTTKGIIGTVTNNNAASTYVGEYIENKTTSSTNTAATNTVFDAQTVTLTAGDWDVFGCIVYLRNGATMTGVELQAGISGATGNSSTGLTLPVTYADNDYGAANLTFNNFTLYTPIVRVQSDGTNLYINGTTSVSTQVANLKGYINAFSGGQPQYRSFIRARRVR